MADILIGADQPGVSQIKVGLQDIGGRQIVTGIKEGGDIVGLIVEGVVDKADARVLVEELVELLSQIAPDQDDLLYPRSDHRIQEGINDPDPLDPDQGLGGIEGDGQHAGTEAGSQEDGPLDPVGFQDFQTQGGNPALFQPGPLGKVPHDPVDRAQGPAADPGQFPLGHRPLGFLEGDQAIEL